MSHYCYDFLADSILFTESFLDHSIHRLEDVLPTLQDYTKHSIDNLDNTIKETRAAQDRGIRTFENPFGDLWNSLGDSYLMTQSILQDTIIVPDPLFGFCSRLQNRDLNAGLSQSLGLNTNDDLEELKKICQYMKEMTAYVTHGFLMVLSRSRKHRWGARHSPCLLSHAVCRRI